jgi:hypothetical protein
VGLQGIEIALETKLSQRLFFGCEVRSKGDVMQARWWNVSIGLGAGLYSILARRALARRLVDKQIGRPWPFQFPDLTRRADYERQMRLIEIVTGVAFMLFGLWALLGL